jgi:pyruvate dehydrogenase complex dehydrogenase (E1) component
VFIGDGETDEPETLGAISLAAREKLDNLVFVINCNLQRLDGPVRGNGKIIQELEGVFRGAAGTSSRSFGAKTGIRCLIRTTKASS